MRILLTAILSAALILLPGCGSDSSNGESGSSQIVMPESSESYCASYDWTLESLEEHFRELGFTNFDEHPVEPDDDDYDRNIYELYVVTGLFGSDTWEAGDEFSPDATIKIYYNEQPPLTPDTCSELADVINGSGSYLAFAEKYDGQFVSFDAYVSDQLTSFTNSNMIEVSGGDYGYNQAHGLAIRVGDRAYDYTNPTYAEGTLVHVEGQVDLDFSEYWDQLYIEGTKMYSILS